MEIPLANSIQDFLNKNTQQHPLPFNTLPPTNRLIIPSLNLDVPLINIVAKEGQDFAEGDFDKELMQ